MDAFSKLQITQLDAALQLWRQAGLPARPSAGWVRAIREALGMSASALGQRLGMTHVGVAKLERSEAQDTITLLSLRKLANALDCELQYALVPRVPLETKLLARAQQVAMERMAPVAHSMSLEAQKVQSSEQQVQIDQLASALLKGSMRGLW